MLHWHAFNHRAYVMKTAPRASMMVVQAGVDAVAAAPASAVDVREVSLANKSRRQKGLACLPPLAVGNRAAFGIGKAILNDDTLVPRASVRRLRTDTPPSMR